MIFNSLTNLTPMKHGSHHIFFLEEEIAHSHIGFSLPPNQQSNLVPECSLTFIDLEYVHFQFYTTETTTAKGDVINLDR
jgi:hypothetical protein